jgi:aldehyde dehydrogenase (NAD+)
MEKYQDLNKQFIGGEWVDGSESYSIENKNPFDGSLLNSFRCANQSDVDRAFASAKNALKNWSDTSPIERRATLLRAAEILKQWREEAIEWLILEVGSTRLKAEVEIGQTYDMIVEASSFPTRMHGLITPSSVPGKENYIYRKPLGVIAIISPWNFPQYLSMRSIAPAIAVGDTVVVKPASQSPVTGGTLIAKIFEEAGLPAGVFNVVIGKSSDIGDYFVQHPTSRLVSFTGSTAVGKGIGKLGGEHLKKLALELGGNNAFIVLDDADIDRAVDAAIFGRFMHQAEICMSTNRILVHQSIYNTFLEKFVERAKNIAYGDQRNPDTKVGPLIDHHAVDHVLKLIRDSVAQGAKLELGGQAQGNVVQPTVLSNVTRNMPIFKEEIFGPAVGIISFKDDDEAVELANDTPYGLSGALHTRDIQRGIALARRVETGMIHINDQTVNDEPQTPFGGEKDSGIGRFGDDFILDELTTVQWVSVQAKPRRYPV